jgi:murein L,D-transpeptidase YafK
MRRAMTIRKWKPCGCARIILLLAAFDTQAAEMIISKSKRSLEYNEGTVSHVFPIGLGIAPFGAKSMQGDRRTPEGIYYITRKNPKSQFYLSLGISYPNLEDAKTGLRAGLISSNEFAMIETANKTRKLPPQGTRLGGDIFIHGGGASSDWTWGCIALNNKDMDFLFAHAAVGDKITILK